MLALTLAILTVIVIFFYEKSLVKRKIKEGIKEGINKELKKIYESDDYKLFQHFKNNDSILMIDGRYWSGIIPNETILETGDGKTSYYVLKTDMGKNETIVFHKNIIWEIDNDKDKRRYLNNHQTDETMMYLEWLYFPEPDKQKKFSVIKGGKE
jgi:hypothetical protein